MNKIPANRHTSSNKQDIKKIKIKHKTKEKPCHSNWNGKYKQLMNNDYQCQF